MSEGHPRQQRKIREIERIRGLVTGHPEGAHRSVTQVEQEGMTIGQHLADAITETLGSWKFIVGQSVFLFIWLIINSLGWFFRWDPYPFILLNLMLSFQAAFTAPIIMMSQNRQASRDRIASELDFEVNRMAAKEVDEIQAKLDELMKEQIVTLLETMKEYRVILDQLHERTDRIEQLILNTQNDRSDL